MKLHLAEHHIGHATGRWLRRQQSAVGRVDLERHLDPPQAGRALRRDSGADRGLAQQLGRRI